MALSRTHAPHTAVLVATDGELAVPCTVLNATGSTNCSVAFLACHCTPVAAELNSRGASGKHVEVMKRDPRRVSVTATMIFCTIPLLRKTLHWCGLDAGALCGFRLSLGHFVSRFLCGFSCL